MLSLRVFTAIANQKMGVLLIPVSSPLCNGSCRYVRAVNKNYAAKLDGDTKVSSELNIRAEIFPKISFAF